MRRVVCFGVLALSLALPLSAQGTCSGEACSAVSVSADGCQWSNKGSKAVRLSVLSGQQTVFVTVLAPQDTFTQVEKGKCVADGGARFEASFPTLRAMPDETVSVARPRPKPSPQPVATAAAALPAATPAPVLAEVSAPVLPKSKPLPPPAYPPAPKLKPAEIAASSAVVEVAKPAAGLSGPACVEGDRVCPPILFKVIDSCVWVLNLNPRPVAFEALVGGRALPLVLEAADGEKADARAAAVASGKSSNAVGAFHMRLRDPFQSAGSGIPVFRARLGGDSNCVKARSEVAEFTAKYTQ